MPAKPVYIRRFLTVVISLITLTVQLPYQEANAGRYRQPAYVTNAYFTNNLIASNKHSRPDRIINVLRAGYPGLRGHLIINLIADKGTHHISIDLLDRAGRVFESHDFPPALAGRDDFIVSLHLNYGGDLPAGGIFFKLYDGFETRDKTVIGTFRILSEHYIQ
ncbi:MAG: hypothetical protein OQL16_13095 [Gammaproteobacteria bacterium]|nr:hypothetical protein [Gammaproteobacteria bacterium]